MKPFTPHTTFGIHQEKHEPLFYSEEGKGGFLPISSDEARKKNEGAGRFGVFRAVNVFNYLVNPEQLHADGKRTCRYEKNLQRLRACYNDLDLRKEGEADIPDMPQRKETIKDVLFALSCPPTLIVETKNGLQPQWVIDEEEGDVILDDGSQDIGKIALYRSINEGIITMTGVVAEQCGLTVKQDPVKDVARVLRAPTFFHKKSEPFLCTLHLPEKSYSYTLAELASAFPCSTETGKENTLIVPTAAWPLNPAVDIINSIDVRKVVPILWPELVGDKGDEHNFVDSENNHVIAMFVDRHGRNIVHPGGGDRIAFPSGPFLLVRNKYFPVRGNMTKKKAASETIEWFFENFDIEPRRPAYPWKVMEEMVDDCWYGIVVEDPCVLFQHLTEDRSLRRWEPVPITEATILKAHMDAWLHERGYANLVEGTKKILGPDERKDMHKGIEDYRKITGDSMRAHAVRGKPIEWSVRIMGDQHRIIVGDDAGFFEVTPGNVERKNWSKERILIKTRCTECIADLSAPLSALDEFVPLLSTFSCGERGGRFLLTYGILCLLPFLEHPIFLFLGDPRTAKTSKMRAITALSDPGNSLAGRTVNTKDPRNVVAAVANYWLITIDNKGNLTADESDQLCTIFSGGENIERTLFTNTGVTGTSLRRPCLISAIEPPKGIKEDLWDRFVALESSLGGTPQIGSKEFDERLAAALPRARGAMLWLASRLLAEGPIFTPGTQEVARRKKEWAAYAERLYVLMGWEPAELCEVFRECNAFIQKSEQQVDTTTNCLQHVLEDIFCTTDGMPDFPYLPSPVPKGRIIVSEDKHTVKISTLILLELLKSKAAALRLHAAAIAQIPETPEKLSRFFKLKEESLASLRITCAKYASGAWQGWKIRKEDAEVEVNEVE